MKLIGSPVPSLVFVLGATLVSAQNTPSDKPGPPALNDPGVEHPLPVPKQTPQPVPPNARQPDVRQPAQQGRDRTASGSESGPSQKGTEKSRKSSGSKADMKAGASERPSSGKSGSQNPIGSTKQ